MYEFLELLFPPNEMVTDSRVKICFCTNHTEILYTCKRKKEKKNNHLSFLVMITGKNCTDSCIIDLYFYAFQLQEKFGDCIKIKWDVNFHIVCCDFFCFFSNVFFSGAD